MPVSTAIVGFQSPQWGSNSKDYMQSQIRTYKSFSTRNGGVILKSTVERSQDMTKEFL